MVLKNRKEEERKRREGERISASWFSESVEPNCPQVTVDENKYHIFPTYVGFANVLSDSQR